MPILGDDRDRSGIGPTMAQRGVKSRGDADIPDVTGRFEAVAKALLTAPGVSQSAKRGFGFSGLLVGGKLFAVPRAGELLVKLPAAKVVALIASGDARHSLQGAAG